MLLNKSNIDNYLKSDINRPFFLVVGDEEYVDTKNILAEKLIGHFIKTSEYCAEIDKPPNMDRLSTAIMNADYPSAVIGLGEYLALNGRIFAYKHLSALKGILLNQSKVIVLLRGVHEIIHVLCESDPHRFFERQVLFVENGDCEVSVTVVPPNIELPIPVSDGIQSLLENLENGQKNTIIVKSDIQFDEPLITVKEAVSAYDILCFSVPQFNIPRTCGNDEQWITLLRELSDRGNNLNAIFDHAFGDNFESLFSDYAFGHDFKNWLYFITLKSKSDSINNKYLRTVLNDTNSYDDFMHNIIHNILKISPKDPLFDKSYDERKNLIKKLPDTKSAELADFVLETKKQPENRIYYLTDCTLPEKQAIIETFATSYSETSYKRLAHIYPSLNDYLRSFSFDCNKLRCSELSDLLTHYFYDYKRQKLTNAIYSDFEEQILRLAQPGSRIYNSLPSRQEILDEIDKGKTFLYWLDALGLEYLGFIQAKCKDLGLSLSVQVGRAELPTITSFNKAFYDDWDGEKLTNKGLDTIKHKENIDYNYQKNKLPVHLAKELEIIDEMLAFAKNKLISRSFEKIVITSDHGASRLAVIKEQELKYETDTKGDHSGRCCKYFNTDDLPMATPENGYLVLADYGRFKGSRAANVEVHGGASLEEVLVPVIELTLKNRKISVELVNPVITVSYRKNAEIILFSKSNLATVSVEVNGKRYTAERLDNNHHKVIFADIKRAGKYPCDVFDGYDLIGHVEFIAENESGKKNDLF